MRRQSPAAVEAAAVMVLKSWYFRSQPHLRQQSGPAAAALSASQQRRPPQAAGGSLRPPSAGEPLRDHAVSKEVTVLAVAASAGRRGPLKQATEVRQVKKREEAEEVEAVQVAAAECSKLTRYCPGQQQAATAWLLIAAVPQTR